MLAAVVVTVVVNGSVIAASEPARIRDSTVVAPVVPFASAISDRVEPDARSITFVRAGRRIRIERPLGARGIPGEVAVVLVPLALVARALDCDVAYDGATHLLAIVTHEASLATATPSAALPPDSAGLSTFPPRETPPPRPQFTGVPRPRRTPILVRQQP